MNFDFLRDIKFKWFNFIQKLKFNFMFFFSSYFSFVFILKNAYKNVQSICQIFFFDGFFLVGKRFLLLNQTSNTIYLVECLF